MKPTSPTLLRKYAGQWVAMNREQDQVIASGRTFDEAKQAAAELGESSIVLAKAPDASGWYGRTPRWLYAVAVFVSLAQPIGDTSKPPLGDQQFSASSQQLDDDDSSDDAHP